VAICCSFAQCHALGCCIIRLPLLTADEHELVLFLLRSSSSSDLSVETMELQWKDYVAKLKASGTLSSALAIADVSPSMSGLPMQVAPATAITAVHVCVTWPALSDCDESEHDSASCQHCWLRIVMQLPPQAAGQQLATGQKVYILLWVVFVHVWNLYCCAMCSPIGCLLL